MLLQIQSYLAPCYPSAYAARNSKSIREDFRWAIPNFLPIVVWIKSGIGLANSFIESCCCTAGGSILVVVGPDIVLTPC